MAAGNTYEPIATTTVSGTSTNSVSFTSIASTYTDLVLVVNSSRTTSGVGNIYLRFNNDSGSNYSATRVYGDGSAASSFRQTSTIWAIGGNQTDTMTTTIFNVMNYANTTTYKTMMSRYASTGSGDSTSAGVALWASTSAINRVDCLLTASTYFSSGSTLTLYGIAAA
jgi:hypothetical protein